MSMYLVSACLVGVRCRYDGESSPCQKVIDLVNEGKALPLCPEQLGGLTTPRLPCEMQVDSKGTLKIVDQKGQNHTEAFVKGAKDVVAIAKALGIKQAILKSKSPSCGYGQVYSGKFEGELVQGKGICAQYLEEEGVTIQTEQEWQ